MYKVCVYIETSEEYIDDLLKIQEEYQIPEPVTEEGFYMDMFGNLVVIEKEEEN